MNSLRPRIIALSLTIGFVSALAGCSATGSHSIACSSNEVAPNSQPGESGPSAALEWYLKNGHSALPRSGFRLGGHTATRYVYRNGKNQVSVGALPAAPGEPRTWVVLITYSCD